MAELKLRVVAEYQDAVKCREELKKVEAELKNLSADASPEKIKALTKQYTDLYTAWETRMSWIGKVAAYTNEGLRSIGKTIKENVSEMSGMGKTVEENIAYTQKRLDLENRIKESLLEQGRSLNSAAKEIKKKGRSLESEKQEIITRNGGADESIYSDGDREKMKNIRKDIEENKKAYDELLLKSEIYKQLIIDSNDRAKELTASLQELNKQKIDETSFNELKGNLYDATQEVNGLKSKIDELTSEKKTIELEIKKNEQIISDLTNIDAYDEKLIENATRYREQTEEMERLTLAIGELNKKETTLQEKEQLLLQTEGEQKKAVEESTERFNTLTEQLKSLTEGTEEYNNVSKQAEEAMADTITNEEALKGTQDSIAGVRAEYKGLVEDRLKAQKKLEASKEKETELITEHENIQKIIDSGVVDVDALDEAVKNKEEANNKLEEKNKEISRTVDLLGQAREGMYKAKDVVDAINDNYKGFVESIDSQATKVFFDESDFKRYHELGQTIENLQSEIRSKVESGNFSTKEIKDLQDELEGAQKEFRELDITGRAVAETFGDNVAKRLQSTFERLYDTNDAVRKTQEEYDNLMVKMRMAKNILDAESKKDSPNDIVNAKKRVDELQTSLDAAGDKLSKFKAQQKDAMNEVNSVLSSVAGGGGNELERTLDALTEKSRSLVGTVAGFAGIGLGLGQVKEMASKAMETRAYFQDIESSMKVFLGSERSAKSFTNQLSKYAYYNKFEFSDLAAASKQMIAYGHNVQDVIPRLDQLSNIASGTGASLGDMVQSYNKAKNIGYIDSRSLQTWAARGLVVKDILKEMGETASTNKVTFDQLNKALDYVTGEGGKYHNLMGEQTNNISAEQGRLEDSITAMYNAIGEKYQNTITKGYKAASDMVNNYEDFGGGFFDAIAGGADFVIDHYKEVAKVLMYLIEVYGTYKAAIIAVNAIESVKSKFAYKEEVAELDEVIKKYKEKGIEIDKANKKQKDASIDERQALGELTEKQAQELKSRRAVIAALDEEMRKRKENAMLQLDESKKKNFTELNNLDKTEDKYKDEIGKRKTKIKDIDTKISTTSDNGVADNLREEREKIEKEIDEYNNKINEVNEKKQQLYSSNIDIEKQKDDVVLQFGTDEEKTNVLEKQIDLKKIILQDEQDEIELKNKNLEKLKEEKKEKDDLLETAKKNHDAAKEELDLLNEKIEKAKEDGATDDDLTEEIAQRSAAAIDEQRLAEELETAQKEVNTAATKVNAATTELDTIKTKANTTQEEINTLQKKKNTIAKGGNTIATKASTTATQQQTITQKLNNITTMAGEKAQKLLSGGIKMVQNSFKALKVEMMTNPFTAIIGAISLLLPLIIEFFGSEDDGATNMEHFGEATEKATSKLDMMFAVLDTVDKESKVAKDITSELTRTYDEYGIKLDENIMKYGSEIEKVQELNRHKRELIDLIKQEAIEKAAAEAIASAQEKYDTSVGDAIKDFKDDLSDNLSTYQKDVIASMIKEYQDEYAEQTDRMLNGTYQQRMEAGQERYKMISDLKEKINSTLEKQGSKERLGSGDIIEYLGKVGLAYRELHQEIDGVNKDKKVYEDENIEDKAAAEKTRMLKENVGALRTELESLKADGKVDVKINLKYKQEDLPEPLKGKDQEFWKKRAINYKVMADSMGKNEKKVIYDQDSGDKKIMTKSDMMEEYVKSLNQAVVVGKELKDMNLDEVLKAYHESFQETKEDADEGIKVSVDTKEIELAQEGSEDLSNKLKEVDTTKVYPGVGTAEIWTAIDDVQQCLSDLDTLDETLASPDVDSSTVETAKTRVDDAIMKLNTLNGKVARAGIVIPGLDEKLAKLQKLKEYLAKLGIDFGKEEQKQENKDNAKPTEGKKDNKEAEKALREKYLDAWSDAEIAENIKKLDAQISNLNYKTDKRERDILTNIKQQLEARKKNHQYDKNAGQKAAQLQQKRYDQELKDLQDKFKEEQTIVDTHEEARIARIRDDAEREEAVRKESHRKSIAALDAERLNEYQKLVSDAKKNFDLNNTNKNRVFAQTKEAQDLKAGIKAYVEYYSTRNNLAKDANEKLSKNGVKVFDADALKTDKKSLDSLLSTLEKLHDKKVIVETEVRGGDISVENGEADALKDAISADIVSIDELKSIGLSDDFITGLQKGEVEADQLAKAIDFLRGKIKTLNETEEDASKMDKKLSANTRVILLNKQDTVDAKEEQDARKRLDERLKALRDYNKEYGTIEERRKAMAEQYAIDIANAEKSGDFVGAATLKRKQESEESALKMEEIKQIVDWESVFSDLNLYSKDYLVGLRNNLHNLMQDPQLSVEDRNIIGEKLGDIDKVVNEKASNTFNWVNEYLVEQKRLATEAKEAQEAYDDALIEEINAKTNLSLEQDNVAEIYKELSGGKELKPEEITASNTETIFKKLGLSLSDTSEGAVRLRKALEKLGLAEADVTAKTGESEKLKTKAAIAEAKTDKDKPLKDRISSVMSAINSDVQKYLGDLPALLDEIGLGEAGEKISKGLSGINDVAGAAADFSQGNYVGAALKGIQAVKNFGSALGIGGGNAAEVQKTIERLTEKNNQLIKALDNLREEMADSKGEKAVEAYNRAISMQKDINKNTLEIAKAQAGYHSAHHSFNYYWDNFSDSEKSKYGKAIGKEDWSGSIWDLSPEEMNKLLSYAEVREKIRDTGKGSYGQAVLDDLDKYADLAREIENLTMQFYETLTGISFDSMYNSFIDKLMDMDSKARDFTQDFEGYMRKAIYESMADETIKPLLKNWYAGFASAMKSKEKNGKYLSETERKELMEKGGTYTDENGNEQTFVSLNEILKTSMEMRDGIEQLGLYNGKTSDQQSSTFNSAQNITYEQADGIWGTVLGMSILMEQSNQHMTMLNAKADDITTKTANLSDIAADSRDILAGMAIHVEEIRDGVVDTIVPRIKNIDTEITKVRKVLEEQ